LFITAITRKCLTAQQVQEIELQSQAHLIVISSIYNLYALNSLQEIF